MANTHKERMRAAQEVIRQRLSIDNEWQSFLPIFISISFDFLSVSIDLFTYLFTCFIRCLSISIDLYPFFI